MTMVPEWKTCPRCHKKYSWNPDVGKIICPHCVGAGKSSSDNLLTKIFGNKKKDK